MFQCVRVAGEYYIFNLLLFNFYRIITYTFFAWLFGKETGSSVKFDCRKSMSQRMRLCYCSLLNLESILGFDTNSLLWLAMRVFLKNFISASLLFRLRSFSLKFFNLLKFVHSSTNPSPTWLINDLKLFKTNQKNSSEKH